MNSVSAELHVSKGQRQWTNSLPCRMNEFHFTLPLWTTCSYSYDEMDSPSRKTHWASSINKMGFLVQSEFWIIAQVQGVCWWGRKSTFNIHPFRRRLLSVEGTVQTNATATTNSLMGFQCKHFKFGFQLHLFGPFGWDRFVSGSAKPLQPNTEKTRKTWTACDTYLSSRTMPRLSALQLWSSWGIQAASTLDHHNVQTS